jgi:hypothetical protein
MFYLTLHKDFLWRGWNSIDLQKTKLRSKIFSIDSKRESNWKRGKMSTPKSRVELILIIIKGFPIILMNLMSKMNLSS